MPNDIEQLKQDFLRYINFLQFLSPEILVDKVSSISQNKLSKIEIKHNNEKILFIETKNKKCHLTKNDLGKYGLSVEDFRKGIEDIKSKDPKKIFSAAVEEIIILHNKKLCEIYIPSTILIYTELYEKFKLAYPNTDRYRIYHLIDVTIENSLTDKSSLTYNYFKRAYQGYKNSTGFASLFGGETEDLKIIFSITKKLKLNFTPYQKNYIGLINLIEQFCICDQDKEAAETLIVQLKHHTNNSFSILIQKSFQNETALIKDFKSKTQELIKNYIEDHPGECKKQRSILDRILWFITKIFPESIFPKDKRMTLFGKYTKIGSKIKNLSNQVIEKTLNLV
ncbi:hypothetical protein [Rickettsiella endosymbiont of Xylota segnis]|uniref:hypothetical protein n=1 Tax=Rickettsiella endosymbiont of Xylota segnis TaxID=3066238 RepID=UPI0030D2AB99